MKTTVLSSIGAACLLAITSCAQKPQDELVTFNFAANYDAPDTENPSSVIDLQMALNPELTDSTLISVMSLRGVIDDTYYIFSGDDMHPGRDMAFDADGRCLVSFSRSGNGPGEYRASRDHWSNAKTKGWMISTHYDGIFNYTFDGTFTGKDSIKDVDNIYPRPEGWLGVKGTFTQLPTVFYYYDYGWKLIDSIVTPHINNVYPFEFNGHTGYMSDRIEISPSASFDIYAKNDTVYDISSPAEGIKPIVAINSDGKRRPDNIDPMSPNSGDYLNYRVFMTKNHAMIMCNCYKDRTLLQIYDRRDGKLVFSISNKFTKGRVGLPFEYNGHEYLLYPVNYTTDDRFFLSASSEVMSEITGDEEANPALFSIQIK